MAHVHVALLGGFRPSVSGTALYLSGRKTRALLAYLAATPGLHHRDRLAALLWGDTGDREARHNLRQALSSLRKGLAAALIVERDTVGLDRDRVEVDVAAFEEAARHDHLDALETASELYRGAFLEGFDGGAGDLFEQWRTAERQRLHGLAVEVLAALLARRMRDGSADAGIHAAQRLLVLEPHREAAHRALMRLYARAGRRGAALRHYEACAELLRRERRAVPEPETRRLYVELLQTGPTPPAARTPPSEPAALLRREGPLVGREPEVATLHRLRRAAASGRPAVVVVQGEAGIGKSRLAAELAAAFVEDGGRVLYGRAYETESILPYRPWIDALRGGALATVVETAERHPSWRAELARLFPELGNAAAPAGPGGHVRLFEAIAHVVTGLAGDQPLLLVLEDLHWADEMSLRLLAFVVRRLADLRVLVVATVRDEERSSLLDQALTEVDAQGLAVRVALGPLSPEDTATLVRAARDASHASMSDGAVARVCAASEGVPFVAVEMVRALVGGGHPPAAAALPVPDSVQHAIVRRLNRLTERGRRLAALAAVIGSRFEFALLQRAAALGPRDAAEGVEELVGHGILRVVDEGLDFTHDLVRQVAYARLLPPTLQALHAAVAEAMERMWASHPESVYDRLAVHFARAGDAPRAVEYLARFAEQAARAYAHGDAVRALDDAIAWVDRLPPPDRERRRLQLVLQQALSLSTLGRFDELLASLERERPRLERVGDPALTSAFLFRLAFTLSYLGDFSRSAVEARRALVDAERCGDAVTAGRTHHVLALEAYYTGAPASGVEHARRAAVLLDPFPREAHWLGLAHFTRSLNHLVLGQFREALAAAADAAALGHQHADRRIQSFAASATGWALGSLGEAAAAVDACRHAIELAPDPVAVALGKARLGLVLLDNGAPDEAIQPLEEAIAALAAFRFRPVLGRFTLALGEAHLALGRLEPARTLIARGFEIGCAEGYAPWGIRARGRLARQEGALAEAERHLTEALERFEAIGARFEAARTRLDLADVARRRGDVIAAGRAATAARDSFEALDAPAYVRRALRFLRRLDPDASMTSPGLG